MGGGGEENCEEQQQQQQHKDKGCGQARVTVAGRWLQVQQNCGTEFGPFGPPEEPWKLLSERGRGLLGRGVSGLGALWKVSSCSFLVGVAGSCGRLHAAKLCLLHVQLVEVGNPPGPPGPCAYEVQVALQSTLVQCFLGIRIT